ncbi:Oidioi.mRNA.OKI2018_I69.XSR.g16857.t1.cds [Oikopleura dioica]|uniref:Oidioi.mRNA.OKI2018_I69.XSR.g16857.t1.cds n=1 Tax=Oikopleura dioica TaxID=34765 RepID=A0ABN7SHX7_OIKDI|nr:Oidioi.mRNA.OKI2018_I69.XSR.g16857.t1.cds [Oikopleura dioica]
MADARWSESDSETESDSSCSDPGDDWDNDFAAAADISSKKKDPSKGTLGGWGSAGVEKKEPSAGSLGGWGGAGTTMESLLAAATGKTDAGKAAPLKMEKSAPSGGMGFSMGGSPGGGGGLDAFFKGGMGGFDEASLGAMLKQEGSGMGMAAMKSNPETKQPKSADRKEPPKFGVPTPIAAAAGKGGMKSAEKADQLFDFPIAGSKAGGFTGAMEKKTPPSEGMPLRSSFFIFFSSIYFVGT